MRKIYKFICITVALFTYISQASGQEMEAPNYDEIRNLVCSTKNVNYYPSLLERFNQCDTTLNLEEYRNLYFGFALTEDFVPYQSENMDLLESRNKFILDGAKMEDCPNMIGLAMRTLENNPFDIPAISTLSICYYQMGDSANYSLWDAKLHGLLDAIGSTGDGESAQSAFYVINIEHEYEILNRLGWELDQVEVIDDHTDFIRVKENTENIKGLYFNFSACSTSYRQKYK